jgi:hypothetical protein
MTEPSSTAPTLPPRRTSLAQLGGGLGIAGCIIGILIFLGGCMGFGAAFYLSVLPLGFGVIGLVLTIIGALTQKNSGLADTQILAAIFVCLFSLVGGILEFAVWQGWRLFA